MVKQEFLAAIREPLKAEGYRKKGFYWYKTVNDLVFCLNLQGSQWDKDDYYFQVGAALHKDSSAFPTILHWLFRHRCTGKNGELNITPQEALTCVLTTFRDLESSPDSAIFCRLITRPKSQGSIGFSVSKDTPASESVSIQINSGDELFIICEDVQITEKYL